jgi:hypothetical protein
LAGSAFAKESFGRIRVGDSFKKEKEILITGEAALDIFTHLNGTEIAKVED